MAGGGGGGDDLVNESRSAAAVTGETGRLAAVTATGFSAAGVPRAIMSA